MTTLTLQNGSTIPQLGLGTWHANKDKVGEMLRVAIEDLGYRHIDCAFIYQNEKEIGEALAQIFARGKVKREDLFITSKLWMTSFDPSRVEEACKHTLQDLQLDYLDLYLAHWGVAFEYTTEHEPLDKDGYVKTANIPFQQTWKAMEQLVEKGLVKSLGVANFTVMMLTDVLSYANIKPAMNQVELHPYLAQKELVEYCAHLGIHVTAYSPLGSPGGAKGGDPILLEDQTVNEIAKAHTKTPAQILLRWGIQRGTCVIPKSMHAERLKENIDVFDFELNETEMKKLNALNINYRFVNPLDWWKIPYFS